MNRISRSVVASIAMFVSGAVLAQSQCNRPQNVSIPDGASATLDQMIEAQTSVRAYLSAMEEYLECMNDMIDSADDDTESATVNDWINDYNEGVGEMESTAERFNEERVAYQQANPSE
jgi:hypothetical protein